MLNARVRGAMLLAESRAVVASGVAARPLVRPFVRSLARSLIRPDGDARLSRAPRPEQPHQTPKPPRSKIRGHFGVAVLHTPGHNESR